MSILKLEPAFKEYIWGGDKLIKDFHKHYSGKTLAESWELSCHADGSSRIAGGAFKGKTLSEYIEWEGKKVLGNRCAAFNGFPVLIKFIDARENLSIQVHPDDEYALNKEGQYGKTEMWYVADCTEDAYLYYGFSREISKEEFRQRIEEETILDVLNKIPVEKGDVFFIEAGTLHAIGEGIVIAEIQQNSNVTYRVYDYGRKDAEGKKRDLHIEKALAVTNRSPKVRSDNFEPHLGSCKYFMVDKLTLDGKVMKEMSGETDGSTFVHILVIEGNGVIKNGEEISFLKGDSLFITASAGRFEIKGNCQVLITTIP